MRVRTCLLNARSAAAVASLIFFASGAMAQESKFPPVADLVGKWDCKADFCGKVFLRIDQAADDPSTLLARTVPVAEPGSPGKAWDVDKDFNPANGTLRLLRYPEAQEISHSEAPEWAREKVAGSLRWLMELRIAKGEKSLGGLRGDKCAYTMKGNFIPDKIKYDENEQTAEVPEGKAGIGEPIATEFGKVWHDPAAIDNKYIFSWKNDTEAEMSLVGLDGRGHGQDVLFELNAATVEATARELYGELVSYTFKAIMYALAAHGAGAALVAEAEKEAYLATAKKLAEEYAQNLVENLIGKAIKGDSIGRELFVEALAATATSFVAGKLLTPGADELPHDALMKKLSEDVGEKLAQPVAEAVKNEGQPDKLTKDWGDQCRFVLRQLKLHRDISGVLVADRATREAGLVLYVPKGKGPSAVVTGKYTYANEDGSRPPGQQHIFMSVHRK